MVAYSRGKSSALLLFAAALIASSSALVVPSAISVRKASMNSGGNNIVYVQAKKQKMILCRDFALLANLPASSANEVDTENVDDDLDEFMKEMFEASATAAYSQDNADSMKELFQASPPNATDDTQNNKEVKTAADNQPPPHFIQRENAVGIGGNDGFVYDVNKLKRNLVQESVRGCKQELLVLLGDGRQVVESKKDGKRKDNIVVPKWKKERDDLIEERLAGLVQTNPVSTTTDSNLLDGDWQFAFQTNSAKTILDTSRFLLSKTKRGSPNSSNKQTNNAKKDVRGGPWRFRSGRTESPFRSSTRQVFLENLSADEDAHIIEKTSMFGGLFQISRRYGVYGLTRTALDLDLMESESKCFGFVLSKKGRSDFTGTKFGKPLEVQILYLDSDLCVSTTGDGLDGPVHIYTKGDLWVSGGAKRKMRLLFSWLLAQQSPLRIRQRLSNILTKVEKRSPVSNTELQAINIGELDITDDGFTAEDAAWDGEDDPFYHLTPGERMDVLKSMSLQDIYKSAVNRKEQNQKQKRRLGGSRKGSFKRPDV